MHRIRKGSDVIAVGGEGIFRLYNNEYSSCLLVKRSDVTVLLKTIPTFAKSGKTMKLFKKIVLSQLLAAGFCWVVALQLHFSLLPMRRIRGNQALHRHPVP